MLCRVDHVEHGHVAVHATYLATDGSQKAAIEPVRKTFGPIAGSAIRFGMPQPDQWLCVGEGIELTLSLCVSTDCPGWAALIEMVKRWWPDLAAMDFVSPARRRARTGVKIPEG